MQYAYIVEGKFYAGMSRGNSIKIHAAAFLFKNVITTSLHASMYMY